MSNFPKGSAAAHHSIYRQEGLPVFQNVTYASPSDAARAPTGDVELVQDHSSGLVFNWRFDPDLLSYDETYQNEQACSAVFRQHLASVLTLIKEHYRPGQSVVELGCGKGYFLELMASAAMAPVGFDPSYEGDNQRVQKRYFVSDDSAHCDLLILRHVLEHIPHPFRFLSTISARARPGAKIYIEVPCFEWIVEHRAFYDIFYEHCNYFTLTVLEKAFGHVHEAGRFFGDQYLYIVAELRSFHTPVSFDGPLFSALDFTNEVNSLAAGMPEALPPLIWGAGAKGTTLSNLLYRRGTALAGLVDINPAKQGRYVGLSALPIHAPKAAAPLIAAGHPLYVMNPNYLAEILRMFSGTPINYRCVA